jgi:hypothetical protein
MIQKLYGNKKVILNSSKIDITRFKTIHNLGKTPLSIRTDLDVKSITILKGYKSFYKIIGQIKKKNQKKLILEYRLYFNFVCHEIKAKILVKNNRLIKIKSKIFYFKNCNRYG